MLLLSALAVVSALLSVESPFRRVGVDGRGVVDVVVGSGARRRRVLGMGRVVCGNIVIREGYFVGMLRRLDGL